MFTSLDVMDELRKALTPSDEIVQEVRAALRDFVDRWLDGTSEGMPPQLMISCRSFEEGKGFSEPQLHVYSLHIDFNSALEKKSALFRIGAELYDGMNIPIVVALASECWSAQWPADKPRPYILPEDDPDRREGIIVFTATFVAGAGGHRFSRDYRNVRRENNFLLVDGEWEIGQPGENVQSPLLITVWQGFMSKLKR